VHLYSAHSNSDSLVLWAVGMNVKQKTQTLGNLKLIQLWYNYKLKPSAGSTAFACYNGYTVVVYHNEFKVSKCLPFLAAASKLCKDDVNCALLWQSSKACSL